MAKCLFKKGQNVFWHCNDGSTNKCYSGIYEVQYDIPPDELYIHLKKEGANEMKCKMDKVIVSSFNTAGSME